MQVISGTVQNTVKLDSLKSVLEQNRRMTGLLKEKKSHLDMSPEQRMLEQFKEQMANDREQNKNNSIATKVMNGETLTPDEEQYLTIKNPGLLNSYRHMKEEQKAEEEEFRRCKTKDEVHEYKLQKMGEFLSKLKSAHGDAEAAVAMEVLQKVNTFLKAEKNFIDSGGYANLPTEADEAIDRAEERAENKEEVLEIIEESAEPEEPVELEVTKPVTEDDNKEKRTDKESKDPLEEIVDICKKYFSVSNSETKTHKPINTQESGDTIDFSV